MLIQESTQELTQESIIDHQISLRLWTVTEYHLMTENGILAPNEPLELIAGKIIKKMSPQGTPHATAITLTRLMLEDYLGKKTLVRTQLPIELNEYSEPEPDVALVFPDVLRYLEHHPRPSEIYLLIEIADKTLRTDKTLKAQEYAKSGIQDYWVLDLNNRQLWVFRQPTAQGYQQELSLEEGEQITPLQFPNIAIFVSEMLPP